jgi:hypothetical protein
MFVFSALFSPLHISFAPAVATGYVALNSQDLPQKHFIADSSDNRKSRQLKLMAYE